MWPFSKTSEKIPVLQILSHGTEVELKTLLQRDDFDIYKAIDASGNNAFMIAARFENMIALQLLIDEIKSICPADRVEEEIKVILALENNKGETALHTAAFNGRVQASNFLLIHGACSRAKNKKEDTCIDYAYQAKVEGFLQNDFGRWFQLRADQLDSAYFPHLDDTAKRTLTRSFKDEAIASIVVDGISYDVPALVKYAYEKNLNALLLRLTFDKANIDDLAESIGLNALHCGILTQGPTIVTELLSSGADANARANNGKYPLHFAVQLTDCAMVLILLRYFAIADIQNAQGYTPYHQAIAEGNFKLAAWLGEQIDSNQHLALSSTPDFTGKPPLFTLMEVCATRPASDKTWLGEFDLLIRQMDEAFGIGDVTDEQGRDPLEYAHAIRFNYGINQLKRYDFSRARQLVAIA